ncbi:hypothetical protein D3C80_1665560 [compost metagenome]
MAQVVIEIEGARPNPEQQGAVERHLALNEAHQRGREGAAVQGIDDGGQICGEGGAGHGGLRGRGPRGPIRLAC